MTMEQEKVQGMLKQKLKEKGLKVTKQRLAVLQTWQSLPDPIWLRKSFFELMQKEYPGIGLATIYPYTAAFV